MKKSEEPPSAGTAMGLAEKTFYYVLAIMLSGAVVIKVLHQVSGSY